MLVFKENKTAPITPWLKTILYSFLLSLENKKKMVSTTEMHDVYCRVNKKNPAAQRRVQHAELGNVDA